MILSLRANNKNNPLYKGGDFHFRKKALSNFFANFPPLSKLIEEIAKSENRFLKKFANLPAKMNRSFS